MNDNIKKKEEIEKLKKNSKCTKYNEIMKEKEIFEQEMINIKSKFNKAMEVQENYKLSLKKIKFFSNFVGIIGFEPIIVPIFIPTFIIFSNCVYTYSYVAYSLTDTPNQND